MNHQYFPFENEPRAVEGPQLTVVEQAGGVFPYDVDTATAAETKNDSLSQYYNFLELHKTCGWASNNSIDPEWKKIVVRISTWSLGHGIQLHDCVILDRESAVRLRDLLNSLVDQM